MNSFHLGRKASTVEALEQRIAPAALVDLKPIVVGSPTPLDADPNTPAPAGITAGLDGAILLYVTKGSCLVFSNDLNGNNAIDFNEITGIAAGDGLRLISFVDIHGDIVTNLRPDGTLTDSDNNAANGRDGQILLNSKIESIELRSVRQDELPVGTLLTDRVALSSYSIFGNIYAGGGFGTADGGLSIDVSGIQDQQDRFPGNIGNTRWVATKPEIGSIRVGTAASGQLFNFGASLSDNPAGQLQTFTPPSNAPGADIINIGAVDPNTKFNIGTLQAGDGGFNGRGGDIINVVVNGDTAGGYKLIAGNGGPGPTGQRGGDVQDWVDLGSITSEVVIKTGNGGQGLVGKGGNGGSLTFGKAPAIDTDGDPSTPPVVPATATSIAARLKITLGDGGSGLTGGGNGGSMPSAKFTSPEPDIPYPLELVSTWHRPGDIGQIISVDDTGAALTSASPGYHALRGFDFDGDGANDVVYTSTQNSGTQSSAVVVLFGDPASPGDIDPTRTLFLDSPDNPDGLTIGDFNGDGKPDIALGSGNLSTGGVMVLLSAYDPLTGAFQGFRDPIYSQLPAIGGQLVSFPPPGGIGNRPQAYKIFELASGDFDGDGAVDLGVMTDHGFFMLRGDLDLGPNGTTAHATGRFFSDTVSNAGLIPANIETGNVVGENPVIKASAMKDGGRDVVFATVTGVKSVTAFKYDNAVLARVAVGLGRVDTNREISDDNKTDKISLTDATTLDFTFLDINGDGLTEISILSAAPQGFLINKTDTDGTNGTLFESFISNIYDGANTLKSNDENRGIRIGGNPGPSNFGLGLSDGGLVGILTTTDNPLKNGVVVVDYEGGADGTPPIGGRVLSFSKLTPALSPAYFQVTNTGADISPIALGGADQTIRAFDVYVTGPGVSATTLNMGDPIKGSRLRDFVAVGVDAVPLERNGFFIKAGDGGDSANGKGGTGGLIGSSLRFDAATGELIGTFDIVLPAQLAFEATVRLVGGNGGDGFRDAGNGGSVIGASVRHATGTGGFTNTALLLSGDGGNSIKGHGGKGGDLKSVYVEGGEVFNAGTGGDGVFGGAGGSIIGNPFGIQDTTAVGAGATDIENTKGSDLLVIAGNGGSGIRSGGSGGIVNGFTPRFIPIVGFAGGQYYVRGGDGGDATTGAGGSGGSVVDCSPTADDNNLNGSIFVLAGRGGDGTRGGIGGDIRNFTNSSPGDISAFSTTFLAGDGGIGTSGPGGSGGTISNVRVDGTGVGLQPYFDLSQPETLEGFGDALVTLNVVPFSRMVAGAGGTSLGNVGGTGGSVLNVFGGAKTSTFAVAAGKGGDGLLKGGSGGNIQNAEINAGSQTIDTVINVGIMVPISKPQVLIIAGEGGDAFTGPITPNNPLSPGRVAPVAGNGGNILNFTQSVGDDVNVQLIAGNGGNTPNAGSTSDVKTKVGRGGSIQNIAVVGRIGDTGDPVDKTDAPIRSYNPLTDASQLNDRMSYFVANSLVGSPEDPTSVLTLVNGDTGNVGIVVGGKGRVRDGNNDGILDPAPDISGSVPNGSLINVVAQHILSAIADNVDRIASIQSMSNVRVSIVGGELGSDRMEDSTGGIESPGDHVAYTLGPTPGSLDYLLANGNHSSVPVVGGRLVDGAIFAKTTHVPISDRDFPAL